MVIIHCCASLRLSGSYVGSLRLTSIEANWIGTVFVLQGYLDPEYYMTNQLSEKSDVYSFGVVLLEMLSARPPIERGRYIVREVRTALNKGGLRALEPLLDPLLGDYPLKQLEAFLDLALQCVEEIAGGRPTMNEVVKKLEVIAGSSQPNSGVHITVEPQKELYEEEYLQGVDDLSFQYSGASFASSQAIEPKWLAGRPNTTLLSQAQAWQH